MNRFLITTALPETWAYNKPILFLGEWCKLYSKKHIWEDFDSVTVDYHWDDRTKVYSDYKYLNQLYERILPVLAERLNALHHKDYPLRYWRILVGPWLIFFIQILFDRFTQIKKAEQDFSIGGTVISSAPATEFVPADMNEFSSFFISDSWNHFLYSFIIRNGTSLPFSELRTHPDRFQSSRESKPRRFVLNLIDSVVSAFRRNKEIIFFEFDLSPRDFVLLLTKHGMYAKKGSLQPLSLNSKNVKLREWSLENSYSTDFEKCLLELIPLQIPQIYVEGYAEADAASSLTKLPAAPKLILTSYVFYNELFKFWMAKKIIGGTKLIISQHGGGYGIGKWFVNEEHEVKIADHFFSWGWDKSSNKVIPIGMFKPNPCKERKDFNQPRLLLVLISLPRYSYKLFSEIISTQWLSYFQDQCNFVSSLSPEIRRILTVKAYPYDYGWDDKQRLKDKLSDVNFAGPNESIQQQMVSSRIIISTYNSTTFLETLTKNVPTIIFWDPHYWELRDEAIPYFEKLKSVGIFHDTPESAAMQITRVWNDVGSWWNGRELQEIILLFTKKFCFRPENPSNVLAKRIKEIAKLSV